MAKFEIFKDGSKGYRFRIVSDNGEITAQSEGYTSKQNVHKAIKAIKGFAKDARITDMSTILDEDMTIPPETDEDYK